MKEYEINSVIFPLQHFVEECSNLKTRIQKQKHTSNTEKNIVISIFSVYIMYERI